MNWLFYMVFDLVCFWYISTCENFAILTSQRAFTHIVFFFFYCNENKLIASFNLQPLLFYYGVVLHIKHGTCCQWGREKKAKKKKKNSIKMASRKRECQMHFWNGARAYVAFQTHSIHLVAVMNKMKKTNHFCIFKPFHFKRLEVNTHTNTFGVARREKTTDAPHIQTKRTMLLPCIY